MYSKRVRTYAHIRPLWEEKKREISNNSSRLVESVGEASRNTDSSLKWGFVVLGVVMLFAHLIKYLLPLMAIVSMMSQNIATDENTLEEQMLYEYMAFEELLWEEEGYL